MSERKLIRRNILREQMIRLGRTGKRTIAKGRRVSPYLVHRFGMMACVLLFVCIGVGESSASNNQPAPRCKYSVRDVAFVNVHGKTWQLDLVKPDGVSDVDFQNWNTVLKAKLPTTNLGYAWHESDSAEAIRLVGGDPDLDSTPKMFLTNSQGHVIPVADGGEPFEQRVDRLVHSPVRKKLLHQLSESLCVFMLIRGNDVSKNEAAKETITAAIEQTEKQMWMMDKASDNGPSVVEVDFDDAAEILTLKSIGIDPDADGTFPAVAIMFGQARRLGDLIPHDQIEKQKLVSLASICGSDCECELDREWLYGDQMLHDWPIELERRTEEGLDFDPRSAFVMAEVAQILQKNSGSVSESGLIDLGAGLMIHNLDEPEPEADSDVEPEVNVDADVSETTTDADHAAAKPVADSPIDDSDSEVDTTESSSEMPWFLFGGLALVALVVVVVRMRRDG
ncbi:hypothetical protein [Mariniblastus fucicola]|uniref:Uncharacterized protein n=1 Tax=Mariniblastus fucicola TaxID=980251 RepID=A0A5B9PI33_9BACT|nr:hypothetical protein [Mariniblastus fucicola]QEG24935.1 hypothetical protein MFFC18_48580 [Mariniblastus fucicola]